MLDRGPKGDVKSAEAKNALDKVLLASRSYPLRDASFVEAEDIISEIVKFYCGFVDTLNNLAKC